MELTVDNKNLQIIGIVDHLANKWGSEDELGEKQSRKMASRNTQNQSRWKVWKYEGASSNMRSLMRENFAYNRKNKTKQGLSQDRKCFRLND